MQHPSKPRFLVNAVMIVADGTRFGFLNDVKVGFVFGKGVLGFFSMASLKLCLVHGWKRRRKA
jgi:hypothetical protein